MSIWKIAEYAVGILVPLGMFWAEERGWFQVPEVQSEAGDPDDRSTGGSRSIREAEEKGALPPLRSPFSNLGQHASCRSGRKSSVRAGKPAVRSAFPSGSHCSQEKTGRLAPVLDLPWL